MSLPDVTEEKQNLVDLTVKKEENDVEEDFVILDRVEHNHFDHKSSVLFSVSSDLHFLNRDTKDNGRIIMEDNGEQEKDMLGRDTSNLADYETKNTEQLKLNTEKQETNRESQDVKENVDSASLGRENLNLRSSTEEEIKGKITTTFEANSNPDGKEIVKTETMGAARSDLKEDVNKLLPSVDMMDLSPDVSGVVDYETKKTRHDLKDNVESASLVDENVNLSHKKCKKGSSEKNEKKAYTSNDIDVLLIGKTGNGKSRTGNTILQKDVFECTDSSTSVTQEVQHEYVQYHDRRIKVVDCPGMEDTEKMDDVEKTTRYLIEKMGDAVIQHPDGYHAFLLVVRYGGRFTQEDKCVINTLKSIFGEDIIRQFSILMMTHGDAFHTANKKKKFKHWCSEQKGVLKELMKECGNRVVLFDNQTKDQEKRDLQMNELIKTIDNLQSRGMRYNHDYFQRAYKYREYLIVEVKEPRILQETNKQCSIISGLVEKLENDDECISKLKNLLKKALKIKRKVQKEDNNTGALTKPLENIDCISKMIANRLEVISAYKKKESELKEERSILLKKQDEMMNNLIKTYDEKRAQDHQRVEEERKEMEKMLSEKEERMHAKLQQTLESSEREKLENQRRMEELIKQLKESNAEDNSQLEKLITGLKSSMNEIEERERKEKQTHKKELEEMRNLHQVEQRKHEDKAKNDFKNMQDSFLKEQKKLQEEHKKDMKDMMEREQKLIEEKQELNNKLKKEEEERKKAEEKLIEKYSTFGKRCKNLCSPM